MNERDEMVGRLSEAMENGEFEMFFQPEYGADGMPIAVESLLRWRHPQRGLVPPVVFLAILEDSGLILPLGRWVLGEACAYHFKLAEAGWPGVAVSVNMSAKQFYREDFGQRMVDDHSKANDELSAMARPIVAIPWRTPTTARTATGRRAAGAVLSSRGSKGLIGGCAVGSRQATGTGAGMFCVLSRLRKTQYVYPV